MELIKKIIPALLIALGVVGLGFCIKAGFSKLADKDRMVQVRGLAEREVKANKVTWPIVSKEVGDDLHQLYDHINTTSQIIINFLKQEGITEDEITVNAPVVVDMQADRYNTSGVPYRYNVTSIVTVTSDKVDQVNKLMTRQADLMKQGVAITAGDYQYQPLYEYTGLNDIKPEMIAEATKKAREAGAKFAEDSGSSLGKIKSATQGQFSITDRDPYTPYIKNVRVVTYIDYYLED